MTVERRVRVLLVDDETQVTRSLRIGLRKEPWEIVTADSAEKALGRLADAPFDVVVSDEQMVGMRGSDFLSQVRAEFPSTIGILLSGQASVEAALKAINGAEIHRFLIKPCPVEEVALTIRGALEKRAERTDFEAWQKERQKHDTEGLTRDLNRRMDECRSLIVDANKGSREHLATIVKYGVGIRNVKAVDSAQRGIDYLKQESDVDIVFIDWLTLSDNLFDFIAAAKKATNRPELKVILLAKLVSKEALLDAANEGVSSIILKPYLHDAVVARIKNLCGAE